MIQECCATILATDNSNCATAKERGRDSCLQGSNHDWHSQAPVETKGVKLMLRSLVSVRTIKLIGDGEGAVRGCQAAAASPTSRGVAASPWGLCWCVQGSVADDKLSDEYADN
jgi:hypothetical protein